MKGQYLAVESVLTVGMGLSLAIGIISVFGAYQDEIGSTTKEKEIETVNHRVQSAIYELKNSDSGTAKISLPDRVGGVQYTVVLDEGVRIVTTEDEYFHSMPNLQEFDTKGSVKGGEVILYKSKNQYTLRSS